MLVSASTLDSDASMPVDCSATSGTFISAHRSRRLLRWTSVTRQQFRTHRGSRSPGAACRAEGRARPSACPSSPEVSTDRPLRASRASRARRRRRRRHQARQRLAHCTLDRHTRRNRHPRHQRLRLRVANDNIATRSLCGRPSDRRVHRCHQSDRSRAAIRLQHSERYSHTPSQAEHVRHLSHQIAASGHLAPAVADTRSGRRRLLKHPQPDTRARRSRGSAGTASSPPLACISRATARPDTAEFLSMPSLSPR